ncbi:MAG TPA: hypothetical protein EYH36_04225 [Desulfocapsa sulfexigens]|nr:hypothetical protein [Desulfocapsa sulfexigens]
MNMFSPGIDHSQSVYDPPPLLFECLSLLNIRSHAVSSLPFTGNDTSIGVENELQVCVQGQDTTVDLPQLIRQSSYFANILKRVKRGDISFRTSRNLESYLEDNNEKIWENSWVRFPYFLLNDLSKKIFEQDLLADKAAPEHGCRKDRAQFFIQQGAVLWIRIPISYLLKLALVDVVGTFPNQLGNLQKTGIRLADHFLNDNTSPETSSFHIIRKTRQFNVGNGIARETAKRFLFTHLLLQYANSHFNLTEYGQTAMAFFSPHPPMRQRKLNECVSDSFYRQLFMSPCLSGWDQGEEKHRYMGLCHEALSRSHLNGVKKMQEAGIILNNLVVLPQTSNISLANNGTHVSLGSRKLTNAMADNNSGFQKKHEKYVGDLAAKIVEHFLPLFVGTYSAAPYRIDYHDFHPETLLGFLPHELDYTHLRMVWRRWRKKAKNRVLGYNMKPFGPKGFDQFTGKILGCKGDFVPDFRLLDYPVALLSTDQCCSQDGILGNEHRLKADLESLGVFDRRISLYQLFKIREYHQMGFSGFEGRYYSLFPSLQEDMSRAADLQILLSSMAFKYMSMGLVDHGHIPGTPVVESERRQIFFGAAIGLPTFFVKKDTPNVFLRRILQRTRKNRSSRRYSGYTRVIAKNYQLALIDLIEEDCSDLVEILDCKAVLDDLRIRIEDPYNSSACGKLVEAIIGKHKKPRQLCANDFNTQAEKYYRTDLNSSLLAEAWSFFKEDVREICTEQHALDFNLTDLSWAQDNNSRNPDSFLREAWDKLIREELSGQDCILLIQLLITAEQIDARRNREREN